MSSTTDVLRRLIPSQTWREPRGISIVVWTAIAGWALVIAIGVFTLLVDLLVTQGRLPTPLPVDVDRQLNIDYSGPRTGDLGLLATAWRFRQAPGWNWLPVLVSQWSPLQRAPSALILLGGAELSCLLLVVWSLSQARYYSSLAARDLATGIRSQLHRQTLRLGPSDASDSRYQTALQLFTHETEQVREGLQIWTCGWARGMTLISMLVVCLLAIEWRLGLQCLIPTGFCWWIYRRERQRRLRGREVADSHVETEVSFLAEGLRKTRLVRGYGVEEFEQQRFQQHLDRLNQESQAARRQERWLAVTGAMLLLAGGVLVSMLIGLRVLSPIHSIPLASGAALAVTLILLMTEVPRLERTLAQQSVLYLAAERLYRYLDEIPEVSQAVGARFIEPVSKSITFESVCYKRDQKLLLQGLDLKLPAKSQIALVSLDPQLPRTVAYLLPRFIEPTAGRVLYDGQDIAWGTLESIRAEMIYVGGDDPVLNGSVSENLLCGDSRYTLQDASEAAKLAHAHSFIMRLPKGYETVLGEHGTPLQPGQAFRLSLARAILRNPAVLVIEEPTDSLDEGTKSLIDDAYQRLALNRTVIYLPSRLTTVRRCDQVVLLHEGKVEALGKHSDLRKSSELYRHWDYTRFNAFRRATGDQEA